MGASKLGEDLGPGFKAYEEWQRSEGLPVVRGYFVDDLRTVPLAPWARKGALGCFINLEGAGMADDAYLCEIPSGKATEPQRHLYEELIFILSGRGATTIWTEGTPKQTFEWGEGSLFSTPLNAWHQHFNGQGDKPARYLAVTSASLMISLFDNRDFIFHNDFAFTDRYNGEQAFFSGRGRSYPNRLWETNLVADVYGFKLQPWEARGPGSTNVTFELASNTLCAHISEFPVGTYKKAHGHGGPGAHLVILSGTGYSLLWPPQGGERIRVDWHKGSLFVPPNQWFHQHFNTGPTPARYLALHWGSRKHGHLSYDVFVGPSPSVSLKEGGAQIEYEDEDPEIGKIFEAELAKKGLRLDPTAMRRKP